MLVTNLAEAEILKQTTIYIELEKQQINRYQVTSLIQMQPLFIDGSIYLGGISKQEIMQQCQISENELNRIVDGEEKFTLFIYEV